MDGHKLLIVEDSEPVAQLLAASLCDRFGEIHHVPTLAAARRRVRLVEGVPFDFIICGLTLADGLGLEFKQWLDESRTPQRVPFVLIAGSLPGLRRPPSDTVLLPKPFQMAELIDALTEARSRAVQRFPSTGPRESTPPYAPGP